MTTPSKIILKQLLKKNCSTYDELKKILHQNNYNPNSIYEYVKYLRKKNYVHTLRMSRKKIVCMNEVLKREIEIILKTLEQ